MTEIYWFEQRAGDVPASVDWLGPSEVVRLETLRFPKRRDDWRLGRWTIKRAVAARLGRGFTRGALAEIEISAAPSGAPEVFLAGRPAPLAISLSHRAGTGLCAIAASGTELGCDLELVEPRTPAFLGDYFTAAEQALVEFAPVAERERLLTLLWSAKESVLKAQGVGLRAATQTVSVWPMPMLQPGAWERFSARSSAGQLFQGWWHETGGLLRTIATGPGDYTVLAIESREAKAAGS